MSVSMSMRCEYECECEYRGGPIVAVLKITCSLLALPIYYIPIHGRIACFLRSQHRGPANKTLLRRGIRIGEPISVKLHDTDNQVS